MLNRANAAVYNNVELQGEEMSLVDKFETTEEPPRARGFDPESARRQLRMSLILVAAMATAAFVLGFSVPAGKSHGLKSAPVAADDANFSGRLVSVTDR
jgi:hypothetical protein